MATRREVLAAAAATVSIPMLQAALGTMRSAQAQTAPSTAPSTAPARGPARGAAAKPVPDEKAGWFTTKLKAADVKDGEFTAVEEHVISLTRKDKDISALSNKCTHNGCQVAPKAGEKILTCPCHGGQFNMDGSVAKSPPRNPLPHFAIRVNADGFIEIDPGQKPKAEDKEFKITVA